MTANVKVFIKAYAKINLTLEVLGERPDGYHELRTVMHSIGIFDGVTVERTAPGAYERVAVECTEPLPYSNTARRAAEQYFEASALSDRDAGGVRIRIEKGVPSEAGLGGASADAAAVLTAMDRLFGKVSREKLYGIAERVGADVPFCLHGGCALCEGVGEKLTALPAVHLPLLIVKGERGVSTASLFRSLAPASLSGGEDRSAALISALLGGRTLSAASLLYNALSPAAEAIAPEIADYRRRLLEQGALGALMSGSGSAVYGVFGSRADAERASASFADCAFCAVTETMI